MSLDLIQPRLLHRDHGLKTEEHNLLHIVNRTASDVWQNENVIDQPAGNTNVNNSFIEVLKFKRITESDDVDVTALCI